MQVSLHHVEKKHSVALNIREIEIRTTPRYTVFSPTGENLDVQ